MIRVPRILNLSARCYCSFTYEQGRYVDNKREYFYTVDHNGQLFLDDARMKNFTSCFKEKKFLRFFFSRIRKTEPQDNMLHKTFRYVSHCGPERNYIRVNATPFVVTGFLGDGAVEYNFTGDTQEFVPSSLYEASDGRLYHTFSHKHVMFSLVKSSVADHISLNFEYENGKPVGYRWRDELVKLDNSLERCVEEALLGR